MRYDIEISGIEAAPQGSKIRTRYGMREASERVGPWRDAVRVEALAACGELIEQACSVAVEFRFLRPKGDFGAKGNLRPSARTHYTTKKTTSTSAAGVCLMGSQVRHSPTIATWCCLVLVRDTACRVNVQVQL